MTNLTLKTMQPIVALFVETDGAEIGDDITPYLPPVVDSAESTDALASFMQEGRDAFFEGGRVCPYAGGVAMEAWDAGYMQAARDNREARNAGLY